MHKAGSRHTDIRHESTSMHTPGQEGLQMIEATSCGGVVIFRGKILVLYKNYKNKYEGWVLPKGTVEAGEEYKETALREVKEETGLDARDADGCYLFTYKRENPGEGDNYFVDVYRFVMDVKDEDLHLQEAETDGYMFATLDEIKAFAAEDKFLHYDSIKQAFEF